MPERGKRQRENRPTHFNILLHCYSSAPLSHPCIHQSACPAAAEGELLPPCWLFFRGLLFSMAFPTLCYHHEDGASLFSFLFFLKRISFFFKHTHAVLGVCGRHVVTTKRPKVRMMMSHWRHLIEPYCCQWNSFCLKKNGKSEQSMRFTLISVRLWTVRDPPGNKRNLNLLCLQCTHTWGALKL